MKFDNKKLITGLGLIAGLAYNSWLLSYLLNPKVAGVALASGLEAKGQPYNWLFISCDVLTGLIIIAIAMLVYKKNRRLITSLIGLLGFGILTALTALLPLDCTGGIRTCGYQGNQAFGLHDLTGAVAAFCLFIGMVYALILSKKTAMFVLNKVTLIVWSVLGLSYLLVGIPQINRVSYITTLAVIWQDIFLITSGIIVLECALTFVSLKE